MKTRNLLRQSGTRKLSVRFDDASAATEKPVKIRKGIIAKTQLKRVFVIDPCPGSRRSLAASLRRTPDLILCGETDNPIRALKAVERLKPDVVLTEILCHQNLDFIRDLKCRYPRLPVIVFSFLEEDRHAPDVLAAGADGFLVKRADFASVADGLRAATQGRLVLSHRIRAAFLANCLPRRADAPHRLATRL